MSVNSEAMVMISETIKRKLMKLEKRRLSDRGTVFGSTAEPHAQQTVSSRLRVELQSRQRSRAIGAATVYGSMRRKTYRAFTSIATR